MSLRITVASPCHRSSIHAPTAAFASASVAKTSRRPGFAHERARSRQFNALSNGSPACCRLRSPVTSTGLPNSQTRAVQPARASLYLTAQDGSRRDMRLPTTERHWSP
jgi:hypothetical protein